MKKRLLAIALVLAMTLALMPTAVFADFAWPAGYWSVNGDVDKGLASQWDAAVAAQNVDATISVAQQIYDMFYPLRSYREAQELLQSRSALAAWCCELKGDLSGAITWLKRQKEALQWMGSSNPALDARLAALEAANSPAIYALTDEPGRDYPGTGAKTTGTLYGSAADSYQSGEESASLMYVTFNDGYTVQHWLDVYAQNSHFAQLLSDGGVFELAWNFEQSQAGVEKVLTADSYINESLAALGSLKATVLLRVGAEMNLWNIKAETYIQAFRKIAAAAEGYDNIKLVFSPNDISRYGVDFASFYPGDDVVDWIGMSTYHESNYAATKGSNLTTPSYSYSYSYDAANETAYWNEGLYEDPLVAIKPIVEFAQSHKKPVMISECGFGYRNRSTGFDQTAYAAAQLTKFYSYVNMVYPQVKAVFFFNRNFGDGYDYAWNENATVERAYKTAIAGNGGYLTAGSDTAGTWKQLGTLSTAQNGTVKLATYAPLPGNKACSVKYYVDNKLAATVTEAPYYLELDTTGLEIGSHTVKAEITSGQFTVSTQGSFGVGIPFTDTPAGEHYISAVEWAVEKGITSGKDATHFAPNESCTRGEIVAFLWRAAGRPNPTNTVNPFTDVKSGDYYYDAVLWAVEKGITAGTTSTTFSPGEKCTRAQAMSFLYRYYGKPAVSGSSPFTDVTGDYYYNAVLWAVANKITAGTSTTTFSPGKECTRSQIVKFLWNARDIPVPSNS